MDDNNSLKKVNLEFISNIRFKLVNNAQLSTAKRKLEENKNYEFRFKIVRTNKPNGITETKLSKRVPLKESLMFFDENKVIFTDIDKLNDVIEIYPLIGGPTDKGKKYEATFKYVKDFKFNEKIEELWILKNPPNSFLKLKIYMYSDPVTPDHSTLKKELFHMNSLPNNNDLETLVSPSTNLNTAKIGLDLYRNSDVFTRLTGDITLNSQPDVSILKNEDDEYKINDLKQLFESKQQQFEDNPNSTTRVHRDINKINSAVLKSTNNNNINHFPSPTKSNHSLPVTIDKKPPIYTNISYSDNLNINLNQLPPKKNISDKRANEFIIAHTNSLNVKACIGIEHSNSLNFNASIGIAHPNSLNFPSSIGIQHPNSLNFVSSSPVKSHFYPSQDNVLPSNIKILEYEEMTYDDEEEHIPDSFCEAFFGVSIPNVDPKLIHDSDKLSAPCGHPNCSMFDAYKPDILFRFPSRDHNNAEINSIIASLCFPKGVKLCFSPNDKQLKPLNNFLIVNTNEVGTRYYIMTYHFYVKYSLKDFNDKYKINPTKDFLNLEKENKELELFSNNPAKQKVITENIEKKLKMCSDFFFNDFIYLPMCICLLSRFPYAKQMEKCLESILKLSADEKFTKDDINQFILHLTKEIPIPPPNKRLLFYIPYSINPVEVCGILYKNLPILNYHLKILIDLFSIDNLILIHHLMLCESKILFIGDNFSLLTEVIEGYVSLLYPLQWTYPYIPILSEELIKYLQTPLPYIMGIDITMINLAMEYLNEEEDIFLVYINKNNVTKFSKKEKKFSNKQLLKNLTTFPEENEKEITINLKEIKKVLTDKKNTEFNMNAVDKKIRQVFSRSMLRLFGDYGKYLSYVDGVPLFNKESYLINHSSKDKVFFERIADSQHFNYFLQYDIKEVFPYFHKLCLRYSNTLKMKTYEKRSNSLSKMNAVKSDNNKSSNVVVQMKTNAVTRNSSFNDVNSDNNSNNSLSAISDNKSNEFLENFLITPYFISEYILKSNLYKLEELITLRFKDNPLYIHDINKVIENQKEFDLNSIVKEYKRYIIPEYRLMNKDIFTKKIENTSSTSVNNILNYSTSNNDYKNKQQYESTINDHLRQILTSKKLSTTQKKSVLNIFKNKEARKIYGKMMFQKKFLELKSLCLSETSFSDLNDLTFNCLLECNNGTNDETEFEEVRLITKSLFFYYKVDSNKKQKFLYQEIIKQNGTFNIWKNQRFWEKWFELDTLEVENFYSNQDIFYFNILISLSKLMYDIKIELLFISKCIDLISKLKLEDKSLVQELQIVIKKQYNTGKR